MTTAATLRHLRKICNQSRAEQARRHSADTSMLPPASALESASPQDAVSSSSGANASRFPMALPEYARYGRQMILPDFGIDAQLRLRRARVLVIGAGGLGCPAIQYLAAAGVGHLTVVDHDVVERSNLARQILHTDERIGTPKAQSAVIACKSINPHISVRAVIEAFTNSNALQLASSHDLILDCTDNPSTRYLISDAAVLADKMLVSAAAQGYEGQIAVWNRYLDPRDRAVADTAAAAAAATRSAASPSDPRESRLASSRGPCYRCVFPEPPRPTDVVDCSEGGVLGCITGLVGTMQAVEAIRILARIGEEVSESALRAAEAEAATTADAGPSAKPAAAVKPKAAGIMTLIAPITSPLQPFRSVRLRPRRLATCVSCGDPTDDALRSRLILDLAAQDYAAFCGLKAPPAATADDSAVQRIDPSSLPADNDEKAQQEFSTQRLLVDVRPKVEFGIASLSHSYNLPIDTIRRSPASALEQIREQMIRARRAGEAVPPPTTVAFVCRRGNDSLEAARLLSREQDASTPSPSAPSLSFVDVRGGLQAYSKQVDQAFPLY